MVTTFGVTLWSVWNYDRAFNEVTRYTQLPPGHWPSSSWRSTPSKRV